MVSRSWPSSVALALLAGCCAVSAAASPASAAGKSKTKSPNGTISGTVTGSIPSSKNGSASVRAALATSGAVVAVKHPGRHGTFAFTLPPGSYAVTATIVTAGGTLSRKTIAVSLSKHQKRTGVQIAPSRVKLAVKRALATPAIAAAPGLATRSYVTERGSQVVGDTAFSITPFRGRSGSWASLTAGLSSVLMAGVQGKPQCTSTLTENSTVLPFLRREVAGKRSRYFAGGKLARNLITPGVLVGGSLVPSRGGKVATLTLTFTDATTKVAFGIAKATITKAAWASAAARLANVIAERLCRTPRSYDVKLHVNGLFDFPTHSSTGVIDATLRASPAGENETWSGSGSYQWTQITYTSKTGCVFKDIQPTGGGWAASIASSGASIKVNWGLTITDQLKLTIASEYCPGIPALPKFPGPSQINLTPDIFTFPPEGGSGAVGGGVNADNTGLTSAAAAIGIPITALGPLGFVNTGTLTVTPVWKYQAP